MKTFALLAAVILGLATFAQAQVEFYTLDALGSVRVVTDEAGAVVARHDYLPFGEECLTVPCPGPIQAANDEQAKRFTGQERDKETGLDYFGARYYEAGTARFGTVDPAMNMKAAMADPQRWNRYAYALNNPFLYVDLDGREAYIRNEQGLHVVWIVPNADSPTGYTQFSYNGKGAGFGSTMQMLRAFYAQGVLTPQNTSPVPTEQDAALLAESLSLVANPNLTYTWFHSNCAHVAREVFSGVGVNVAGLGVFDSPDSIVADVAAAQVTFASIATGDWDSLSQSSWAWAESSFWGVVGDALDPWTYGWPGGDGGGEE